MHAAAAMSAGRSRSMIAPQLGADHEYRELVDELEGKERAWQTQAALRAAAVEKQQERNRCVAL